MFYYRQQSCLYIEPNVFIVRKRKKKKKQKAPIRNLFLRPGMVVHTCHHSTQETEREGSQLLRPACTTYIVCHYLKERDGGGAL